MASNSPPALTSVAAPVAASAPPGVLPPEIREALGPPPLTAGEDQRLYERILTEMANAVAPRDFVEWIWVRDLVDVTWEAARARGAKAVCLQMANRKGVMALLEACRLGGPPAGLEQLAARDRLQHRADRLVRGDVAELAGFGDELRALGLDSRAMAGAAYLAALDGLERLQRLIDLADARRDACLREIDRRRDSLARRARAGVERVDEVIDAEFE